MKKTNNAKVNKVNENAKVNNTKATKANNETKATAAQTNKVTKANNIDAKQLTTVQIAEGCSVTIENKTFEDMKSWAYHLTKDIENLCLDVNYAVEDGSNIDFIHYTEDELNEMIAMAGFAINIFDPNDTEVYRDYYNAYGCCRYIIDRCMDLIHAMHGNYDSFGWVKSKCPTKYGIDLVADQIVGQYEQLITLKSNIASKLITKVPYTRAELCSISGVANHVLGLLDKYDCSDECNVEVTKYFCTETINIVNDLLETITTNAAISCLDNKHQVMSAYPQAMPKKTDTKPSTLRYEEYDDF